MRILLILLCALAVPCPVGAFAVPAHSSEPEIFSNQFLKKISFHVVLLSVKIRFPSAQSFVCSGAARAAFFFCLRRFFFCLLTRLVGSIIITLFGPPVNFQKQIVGYRLFLYLDKKLCRGPGRLSHFLRAPVCVQKPNSLALRESRRELSLYTGRLFQIPGPSVRAQKPNSLALRESRRELSLCTGRLFQIPGPSVRAQKPNSLALRESRRELSLYTGRLFLFPGPAVRAQKPNSLALRESRREPEAGGCGPIDAGTSFFSVPASIFRFVPASRVRAGTRSDEKRCTKGFHGLRASLPIIRNSKRKELTTKLQNQAFHRQLFEKSITLLDSHRREAIRG